jgi:hypothetical protein
VKYDNITVVAIYGNNQGMKALPALNKTAACLPGCRKLLITNRHISCDIPQRIIAAPLDYFGYSNFCMFSLWNYIDTDYALIVQHDGWALNADNWRDEWLEYDYIGGLTHAGVVNNMFITRYQWVGIPGVIAVQNGGFSLRSKKMMSALVENGIMPTRFDDHMLNNEDIQLTAFLRPALESVGIKFAPDEESKLFSFEHLCDQVHDVNNLDKIFGHHSRFRTLLNENTMLWHLSKEQMEDFTLEDKAYDLFSKHYNYKIIR